jgi:hypothetical protein
MSIGSAAAIATIAIALSAGAGAASAEMTGQIVSPTNRKESSGPAHNEVHTVRRFAPIHQANSSMHPSGGARHTGDHTSTNASLSDATLEDRDVVEEWNGSLLPSLLQDVALETLVPSVLLAFAGQNRPHGPRPRKIDTNNPYGEPPPSASNGQNRPHGPRPRKIDTNNPYGEPLPSASTGQNPPDRPRLRQIDTHNPYR